MWSTPNPQTARVVQGQNNYTLYTQHNLYVPLLTAALAVDKEIKKKYSLERGTECLKQGHRHQYIREMNEKRKKVKR